MAVICVAYSFCHYVSANKELHEGMTKSGYEQVIEQTPEGVKILWKKIDNSTETKLVPFET